MTVIRTLSNSESNEQRELEKRRLEKEYKRSDTKLDSLVMTNAQSIKDAMQIFGIVSRRLAQSQERLKTIKENLSACKHLLHCKRDELKERWLEGIEHKHAMLLLEQIEEVQDVGDHIGAFVNKKHYLHATRLLMSALKKLETDLKMIEAMKEVHSDLLVRKENMYETFLDDLHKHLYQKWTKEVLAMRRQGSGRESFSVFCRTSSERTGSAGVGINKYEKSRKNLLDIFSSSVVRVNDSTLGLQEDVGAQDPEENSKQFIAIIIECLTLLGKLPEAIETVKSRMQKELSIIMQRTTQQMLEMYPNSSPSEELSLAYVNGLHKGDSREAKLLQELLQTVFEQFQLVVAAHGSVLESMWQSADKRGIKVILYTMSDIWAKVQASLQLILTEYLDLSQIGPAQHQTPASFNQINNDLSSFFSKKRTNRPKTYSLFKFDASCHALAISSYKIEQNNSTGVTFLNGYGGGHFPKQETRAEKYHRRAHLICPSSPHNITAVFNLLMSFIKEIEEALGCLSGTHCPLYLFVTDYVKDGFLAQLHVENATRLEKATKALDQWELCRDQQILKTFKITKPILQSTVTIWESIEDLHWLLSALPFFADHFLSMMCNALLNYKETCHAAYRGIIQPESEDKRIISATWAKDEDIKRFLRDLPNWQKLQEGISANTSFGHEENLEAIGERNRKEAEILSGNLGGQLIPDHEILGDHQQLRALAHLQESMEWFGNCIVKFSSSLPLKSAGSCVPGEVPPVSDSTVLTLTSLAKDFEELAQTCLIVLHLEVRLHCFYFLLPVAREANFFFSLDSQEADEGVLKLNKDLSVIDDTLTSTLQSQKCKYIFEGLGPLLSNILVDWTSQIKRINANGIKKVCRNIFCIQQQLTNITMTRELALDKARQYYELLYLSPDEILNNIVNRGRQFSELEYSNALQLLYRSSYQGSSQNIQSTLQRLSDILRDTGIVV